MMKILFSKQQNYSLIEKSKKLLLKVKKLLKFSGSRFSIKIIAHSTTHRAKSDVSR